MEVPDDSQSEQQNITSEAPSDQDSPSPLHNENKDSIENTDILSFFIHEQSNKSVWMKLEEQNAEVFKDYCKRAILIKEINELNSLLKKQYKKMDDSANPIVRMAPQRANKLPGPLTLTFGTTPLDVAYNSEASAELQLPSDGHPRENLRYLAHIPRAFGFTNLISDSTNLEDLGPLGRYPGSPFLLSSPPAQSDTEAKDKVRRPET
ncbi:hypothetical protein V2J09_016109 [Rumex salicifolius]